MVRGGGTDALEDLVDVSAQDKQAGQGRNDRSEPLGLGWLEFDLVRVMVAPLLLSQRAPAVASRPSIRRRLHGGTVLAYGSDAPRPRL